MYVCTDSKGSRVRFTVEAIKKKVTLHSSHASVAQWLEHLPCIRHVFSFFTLYPMYLLQFFTESHI